MFTNDHSKEQRSRDRMRKSTAVLLGDTNYKGCLEAMKWLLKTLLLEYKRGYSDTISVTVLPDNSYIISENGRGVVIDGMINGAPAYKEHFQNIYSFSDPFSSEGYSYVDYNKSLTPTDHFVNVSGMSAVQFVSNFMEAISFENGKMNSVSFKNGYLLTKKSYDLSGEYYRGTVLHFAFDSLIFSDTIIPEEEFEALFNSFTIENRGLKIRYFRDGQEKLYHYENGVYSRVDSLSDGKLNTSPLVIERLLLEKKDSGIACLASIRAILRFSESQTHIECYHNGFKAESEDTFIPILTDVIEEECKKNGVAEAVNHFILVTESAAATTINDIGLKKDATWYQLKLVAKMMLDEMKKYILDNHDIIRTIMENIRKNE